MRIGILGSGLIGGKLGTVFARAGHEVTFSYAHSRQKLAQLAEEAGAKSRPGTPAEAARNADALLLAVHWSRVDDVLTQAGNMSGKPLLTCSLPMSEDNSQLVIGLSNSGAEALAAKVPRMHVVSAFCTVPSEVLIPVFEQRKKRASPDLIFCGDDEKAKATAAGLIRDVGFNPRDVGSLSAARYVEPFALLVAKIAYSDPGGPEFAYRFVRFPNQSE
jgi:hypothetical protein